MWQVEAVKGGDNTWNGGKNLSFPRSCRRLNDGLAKNTFWSVMTYAHAAPRRGKKKKVIFISLAVVFIVVATLAALYTLSLGRSFDDGRTVADVFPDEAQRPAAPEPDSEADKAQNILLLGSDTRGEISDEIDEVTGTRADAIMVVHVPAERDEIDVMSIMRDNWVPIEGHGHGKINAALAYGGVPLMVATVENFIDARIDHVAVIDFDGFEALTDALGGVTVTSDHAFTAGEHEFTQGPQQLDGASALAFVRERKSFKDGDYQRARNQQAYMKGVMERVLSRDTLTSPKKISDVVGSLSPYMTVNEELDSSYLAGLGFEMRSVRGKDVRFFTSPTLGTGWEGNQSVVRPDWDEIEELQEHFRNDTLEMYEP